MTGDMHKKDVGRKRSAVPNRKRAKSNCARCMWVTFVLFSRCLVGVYFYVVVFQTDIEAQRKELEHNSLMSEIEKKRILNDIAEKEAQLNATETERQRWLQKLKKLENTMIVGGENLLDKAEEQERLLEASSR